MNTTDPNIPDHFQMVHLDRVGEPGHARGSAGDRYTLLLPLGSDGRILESEAQRYPDYCRVSRSGPGDGVLRGLMRPGPNRSWSLEFGEAEETGFRFAEEQFSPGQYVTVLCDGNPHTYRVVSRQPL
jgi:hypothetical protein